VPLSLPWVKTFWKTNVATNFMDKHITRNRRKVLKHQNKEDIMKNDETGNEEQK
jgi:hypothetical protein